MAGGSGDRAVVLMEMPGAHWRFGVLLQSHLARQGLSGAEFARRAGCSRSFPSSMMAGSFRPPSDEETLEAWATVLGLNEEERDRFVTLALLEHTPRRIAEDYRKLRGL